MSTMTFHWMVGAAFLLIAYNACADPIQRNKLSDDEIETLLRRVIGGQKVKEGAWPWLVSLKAKIPTRTFFGVGYRHSTYYCGASLINKRWILTAAHCVVHPELRGKGPVAKYYEARLGDKDLESSVWEDFKGFIGDIFNKDSWKDWVIKAEKIIVHPKYNPSQKWLNDIALVKLSEDVPSQPDNVEDIQEVALAEQGDVTFPSDGQQCIFKGWGCRAHGKGVSGTAFQVALPKVSDRSCARLWNIDTTTRLCAGHDLGGKGICSGDSGGPLVCKKGNKWVQVGIASFTAADAPESYPGAFTRVSHYTDWIKNTIKKN